MAAVRFLLSEDNRAGAVHARLACAIHLTHLSACSVHSAAKTLHDTEHGLVCLMHADENMRHVLLHHLRAVPGDLVAMDAILVLPEQYRASKENPVYLHVRSWRVIDFQIMPQYWHIREYTSVSKCICYNLPFKASEVIVRLEAVDMSTPQNFAFNGEMPPVRLTMRGVPVQASLDNLSRLCFLQRTICTVCRFREAKHESLQTCSKPADKRCFAMLCDVCCKELFVLVKKCPGGHATSSQSVWKAPKWVLDLEAKDELYFLSRVQEPVGVFGHPKTPNCGIYALKHEAALAQGFASWFALFVHEQQQKSVRLRARKLVR